MTIYDSISHLFQDEPNRNNDQYFKEKIEEYFLPLKYDPKPYDGPICNYLSKNKGTTKSIKHSSVSTATKNSSTTTCTANPASSNNYTKIIILLFQLKLVDFAIVVAAWYLEKPAAANTKTFYSLPYPSIDKRKPLKKNFSFLFTFF